MARTAAGEISVDLEELRLAVYEEFQVSGRPPSNEALAGLLHVSADRIRRGLLALHEQRHVVLNAHGSIVMAHPFAAVPLGFSVMGRGTLWWGGCAWDSFAMAHLLTGESDVLVATRCPACDSALAFVVGREQPPAGDQVAHLLVPRAQMWKDVVHTCGHQRLFCNRACVQRWLEVSDKAEGYILDLDTLWRLASRWYEGRFERGYQRRDPGATSEYLATIGLRGPFWQDGVQEPGEVAGGPGLS
jgi:hypothetical protein